VLWEFSPGRNERGAIGKSVIKQDRELMSMKRMEERRRLRCGPPLKASLRKPAEAKPIAMAVEG